VDERVWTVVQPHQDTDQMVILAMLPSNCGHYAHVLAQAISIGSPHRASALQMSRADAVRSLMRTQFGVELALRAVEPKP
jgi:hypothetical protein